MARQLSFKFEDEWWMRVISRLSDDRKNDAISAIKEMLIAYFENDHTREVNHGE